MAYVGTARNLGNDQNTLRSVVLGEASGQGLTGETAVAAVIYNRAALNQVSPGSFPGGDTAVGVATAPNQFQGQVDLSRYSPAQIAQADQAIANAQGGIDPTMGATYYANPSGSTASWARNLNSDNSVKIGAHYFTDNTDGLPFQGNPAVAADGTVTPSPAAADATPTADAPQAPADGTVVQTPSTAPDGTSTVQADPTAANPLGSLGGGLGGLVSQIPVVGPMLSGLLGGSSGGTSAYSPTPANPASDPIAIATGADEQSKTAAADTKAADDTATANTASVTGTANSIYGLTFGTLSDGAMRIALVVIGMICLAGALYLVASEQGQRVLSEA